jgi:hypothetical protein
LLGVAVRFVVRDLDGTLPSISRWAIGIFIVLYPAFDAAVGVSSGIIVHRLQDLGNTQSDTVEAGLQAIFWGPVTGSMAIVAAVSWLIALLATAWAWRKAGAPLYVVMAFALAGLLLGIAHIRPFGPLACLSFLVGAMWVVFRSGTT